MADAEESDEDHGGPAPHTPPQRRTRPGPFHPHHRANSDASLTNLSPPASPSLSLSSLGMSPLSPLRRQFSPSTLAPSSPLYPQSESDHHGDHESIAPDSRDALVQRLTALAARLSQRQHVEEESIDVLRAKVDELENVLSTPDYSFKAKAKAKTRPPRRPSLSPGDDGQDGSNLSGPPHLDTLLPSDVSSLSSPIGPSPAAKTRTRRRANAKPGSHASRMTVAQAEQVVAEAHALSKGLETVISNLRDRQEETEHIHALLITRLERAAQRIIDLEEQLRNFESERKEGDAEMLNLQIRLKAIEVQCLSYVPKDADEELRESIDTWRKEFSALKQRRARNKERFNDTPTKRRPGPAAM
ncbi:hypothetical protein GGR51DRAFT_507833 [Nemania sp. FL0031]|nr:hypothetical protein GGR51DRAFT_507833 [Nemania sp. FL0031]